MLSSPACWIWNRFILAAAAPPTNSQRTSGSALLVAWFFENKLYTQKACHIHKVGHFRNGSLFECFTLFGITRTASLRLASLGFAWLRFEIWLLFRLTFGYIPSQRSSLDSSRASYYENLFMTGMTMTTARRTIHIAVIKTTKMPRLKQLRGLNCCCWTSLPLSTATRTGAPSITFAVLVVSIL